MATDHDSELDAVDGTMLAPIVARAVGRAAVQLLAWHWTPLAYDAYLPGRRLVRFAGQAVADGVLLEWAVVLKLLRPDAGLTPRADTQWRREVQAYASGLLADLPGGLVAPQAFAVSAAPGGTVWLWLEQVVDMYGGRWDFVQFRQAAYHLGAFNGAYLGQRALPTDPWLVRHWPELHSETVKIPTALAEVERLAGDPRVRAAFPDHSPAEMAQLLRDQPRFKAALGQLPVLLSHHDASQANLFARRGSDGSAQTVAIDWESIGYGTFGADIATLVFGTIRRGRFAADRVERLDQVVFDGYLAGLQAAGWRGETVLARLGFVAAIALRWFQLQAVLRLLTNPDIRPVRGTTQEPPEEARRQFVVLTQYLLARAEEARGLLAAAV